MQVFGGLDIYMLDESRRCVQPWAPDEAARQREAYDCGDLIDGLIAQWHGEASSVIDSDALPSICR